MFWKVSTLLVKHKKEFCEIIIMIILNNNPRADQDTGMFVFYRN